jgi:hypothetical protein
MMKKINAVLIAVFFLILTDAGYGGTVASPYEVGGWSGFRTAAISYTFDDQCSNQFSVALPMFNSYGFKMTFYPVPGWGGTPWSTLQTAASQGHEVGSHTWDHKLSGLSDPCQIWELSISQTTINSHIPGNQCLTIAYPGCSIGKQSLIDDYYIVGRTCSSSTPNPATPSNLYLVQSVFLGTQGLNSLSAITAYDDTAAAAGGWGVFTIHGIDSDGGYSPISSTILNQSLQYLDARRNIFWQATFLNVTKYLKERNDVSVSETSNTGDIISVSVTDTLNNTIYNYPVTIRRPLPTGWTGAVVRQNGYQVNSSIVTIGPTQYVMFDVVPDGGDVLLTRTYGDFLENGIVDINDLSSFFDVWIINNCDATEGIDLDDDCNVNFYEFAVFANNWLIEQ